MAKILSHWLTTGLPLTLVSPLLAPLYRLSASAAFTLVLSLAVGTPAVSAIGAIGAGLTASIRRGGLILPLIVLPLLAAFSLAAILLAPFAAAAALRLHLAA